MKLLAIVLILPVLALVHGGDPNEAEYCAMCEYHTMCGTVSGGSACVKHKSMPPTEEEKQALLHSHNRLRNRVARGKETLGNPGPQYKAANMMKMEWDDELAKIAQRAADQCVFGHDCGGCRTVIGDRFGVGQNIAIQWNSNQQSKVNFTGMAESWYLTEVGLMDKDYAKNYVFGNWGHYSQYVWWNSRLVGCGAAFYDDGGWKAQILFCNYGSGGNMPSAMMYEVGSPASNCPEGTKASDSNYKGLCVIQNPSSDGKFSTDGVLLGMPEGTYAMPGKCERKGFRV